MKNLWSKVLAVSFLIFSFSLCAILPITGEDNSQSATEETKEEETPEQSQAQTDTQVTISVKPKYYGIEMKSDHLIFVIDVTGSMSTELDMSVKEKAKKMLKPMETGGNKPKPEKDKNAKNKRDAGEGIDWDKIKNHLDLARAEFVEAIKSLKPDISFAALAYNTKIFPLQNTFVLADQKNKDKVIKAVNSFKPEGPTDAFFEALLKAISYAKDKAPEKKQGKDSKNAQVTGKDKGKAAKKKEEPPYEIFFLTDGAPTVTSATTVAGMPEEKIEENLKKLQEAIEKKNVCIHAIGIGFHNTGLMQKIAEIGNGQYVNLGPDRNPPREQK
ncbi:MAG: VWA domain-containing protein [Planctomycetes bacterium]|nr:VWA domain-containing protein [Planctomycetota bacterium]